MGNPHVTTSRTIGDRELTLTPGRRYLAARPMFTGTQKLFPITIHDITDGATRQAVEVLECFSYDEANTFLAAFNDGESSFAGRVWSDG